MAASAMIKGKFEALLSAHYVAAVILHPKGQADVDGKFRTRA